MKPLIPFFLPLPDVEPFILTINYKILKIALIYIYINCLNKIKAYQVLLIKLICTNIKKKFFLSFIQKFPLGKSPGHDLIAKLLEKTESTQSLKKRN